MVQKSHVLYLLAQACEPQEYSQTNSPPKSEIAIRKPAPYGQDARHMDLSLVSVVVHPAASHIRRENNSYDVRGEHSQNHYAYEQHVNPLESQPLLGGMVSGVACKILAAPALADQVYP